MTAGIHNPANGNVTGTYRKQFSHKSKRMQSYFSYDILENYKNVCVFANIKERCSKEFSNPIMGRVHLKLMFRLQTETLVAHYATQQSKLTYTYLTDYTNTILPIPYIYDEDEKSYCLVENHFEIVSNYVHQLNLCSDKLFKDVSSLLDSMMSNGLQTVTESMCYNINNYLHFLNRAMNNLTRHYENQFLFVFDGGNPNESESPIIIGMEKFSPLYQILLYHMEMENHSVNRLRDESVDDLTIVSRIKLSLQNQAFVPCMDVKYNELLLKKDDSPLATPLIISGYKKYSKNNYQIFNNMTLSSGFRDTRIPYCADRRYVAPSQELPVPAAPNQQQPLQND